MGKDWIYMLNRKEPTKNYLVYFYRTDKPLSVTARDGAKIKYAIQNEIKCFEIGDSLYMTSSVSSVERNDSNIIFLSGSGFVDYDVVNIPKEQAEAKQIYLTSLNMNSWIDNGKLLNSPNLQLTKINNAN